MLLIILNDSEKLRGGHWRDWELLSEMLCILNISFNIDQRVYLRSFPTPKAFEEKDIYVPNLK